MPVGAIALVFLLQVPASSVRTGPDSTAARRAMAATFEPADSTAAALRRKFIPDARQVPAWAYASASDTLPRRRRRSVEYSDWYYRRLTIHKAASFATVPLFVTEYILGDKLYKGEGTSSTRSAHQAVATGVGVLFGVNTITGVWNLWESRHESQGRARRTTHAILMMASDAGFVATAALAPEGDDFGEEDNNNRSTHRNVAIGSMGVSLVSYLMMYLWK